MTDISKLSSKELKALLAQKREEEHKAALEKRAAYEGIRAELVQKVENKVRSVCEEVKGLHDFCVDELEAFRQVLAEYGQLRNSGQMNFKIQEGNFCIEVKSCKVKKFDERADAAASRLIEFLQAWIEGKEDGQNNPMYQLAMTLLERNKYGDLDYKSISKLYELEERFNDPEYSAIMTLFKESHLVEGTSTNFYFSEKNSLGVWKKLEPSFNRL
ncbi:DUF3164 family protein [Parabacteroides sp. AM08-6]|uniref:DUF3164 family protein n=1 Tax=Parabacteroides sp. AM08-6 TaxID=2292053 RepID=UPI000EFE638A|nr:DUF3164 family protein [Parabacteroides sp. AM08-6]RHJ87602.1 DUF3164 family protein [Parabacteroides sp. AM08-6]